MLRKILSILTALTLFTSAVYAEPPVIDAKSYILMEASTGQVLSEDNSEEPLPPASVTKIMTLLLIYDAVEQGKIKWEDTVTVSEHAAGMGGSQIFLEPNEQQSVETLTKSIAIASANDAAVAMAEFIGGSEESFVSLMNEKAKALLRVFPTLLQSPEKSIWTLRMYVPLCVIRVLLTSVSATATILKKLRRKQSARLFLKPPLRAQEALLLTLQAVPTLIFWKQALPPTLSQTALTPMRNSYSVPRLTRSLTARLLLRL